MPIDQSWSLFFSGVASYEQNDLDTAERYFAQIADHRYVAQVTTLRDAMSGLALIHQISGRTAEATDYAQGSRRI